MNPGCFGRLDIHCSPSIECRLCIKISYWMSFSGNKHQTPQHFWLNWAPPLVVKSILFKIRGYHRSMKMGKVLTFPGNYSIGEGNTINISTSISSLLLNASCRLIKSLKRYGSSIYSEYFLVHLVYLNGNQYLYTH